MVEYQLEGNSLAVTGDLVTEGLDEFVQQGMSLLEREAPKLILDIRATSQGDSAFLGAIAQLGAEAKTRDKTLIVRATGKNADVMVWAGLHRIVTLYISSEPNHIDQ
jgi:anti-anti-sigma regulatory factor